MPIAREGVEQLQIQKLIYAVRTEDIEQVQKLCEKGVQHLVNYNDFDTGMTALIAAVTQNNEKMIQVLLQLGAHPDVVDFSGRTALMYAVEYGHIEALQLLRNAKTNPTIQDFQGKDAIYYSCVDTTKRHKTCFKILLEMRANVNNRTKNGVPNLVHICANSKQQEDFCIDLIRAGADTRLTDKYTKRTALHNACLSGNVNVVRELLRANADPNALDSRQSTPAHEAAKGGHFECIQVLSGFGAKFDVNDILGNNPIHYAVSANAGNIVRFLGQRGCNPKSKNLEGLTPKQVAEVCNAKDAKRNLSQAENGYYEMNVNLRPDEFRHWKIMLYDYIYENHEHIEELFQEHDIAHFKIGYISSDDFKRILQNENLLFLTSDDINDICEKHEKEPVGFDYKLFLTGKKYLPKHYLMNAFEGKKIKVNKPKKTKKKKPALPIPIQDEGPRTENGNPPKIYGIQHVHHTDNTRFSRDKLPKNPLEDDSPWYLDKPDIRYVNLCDAAYRGDLQTLSDAFKNDTPVDITDKFMKTPLMVACAHGDLKTVKFLLSNGADIHKRDNFKWTPLHHAAHSGILDVVQACVEAGASINAESITKTTPLMRAIETSSFPVCEYLISKGAKVMHENISGLEPLTIAAEYADPRIYHLINERIQAVGGKKAKTPIKKKTMSSSSIKRSQTELKLVVNIPARRGSLLGTDGELEQPLENPNSIAFIPKSTWIDVPTTKEILHEKAIARQRLGWEVDFQDFKMPFTNNINKRLEQMSLPEVKI